MGQGNSTIDEKCKNYKEDIAEDYYNDSDYTLDDGHDNSDSAGKKPKLVIITNINNNYNNKIVIMKLYRKIAQMKWK